MRDIYERLRTLGFDAPYVRQYVLPDWWEDGLAKDPSNRAVAEMVVARMLRAPLSVVRDRERSLPGPAAADVRLKKHAGITFEQVRPAILIARRAAEAVVRSLRDSGSEPKRLDSHELRRRVGGVVTLAGLLDTLWDAGIPVIRIGAVPAGAKRIDGAAMTIAGRPVIVLSSGQKAPPHVLWHLAHEAGHVFLGHLEKGDTFDVDANEADGEADELEADTFAEEVLHGRTRLALVAQTALKAAELAQAAVRVGQELNIDPGVIVANYAYTMHRQKRFNAWPSATAALKLLGSADGAPDMVRERMFRHVDLDVLTESERHFIESVTSGG